MPENTHLGFIDKRKTISQLLDTAFIIRQRVIPQIIIPERVIPLITHRTTSPVTESYHHETDLCQPDIISCRHGKLQRNRLSLRSGINIRNNRVTPG